MGKGNRGWDLVGVPGFWDILLGKRGCELSIVLENSAFNTYLPQHSTAFPWFTLG